MEVRTWTGSVGFGGPAAAAEYRLEACWMTRTSLQSAPLRSTFAIGRLDGLIVSDGERPTECCLVIEGLFLHLAPKRPHRQRLAANFSQIRYPWGNS